jgi:hypothetical protein
MRTSDKKISEIQKKYLKAGCPECKGKMFEVENNEGTEMYLWCENCDVSMDSSGGYTN